LAVIGIDVSSKKKQDTVPIGHRKESVTRKKCEKLLVSHGRLLDYVTGKY
jgi:hypothetical protein